MKVICKYKSNIDFSQNAKLQIMEKRAFICTVIENHSTPSSVMELKEGWCDIHQKNLKFLMKN